ncbi:MAG: hypothetical protein JWO85_564 [Candidatus Eremiobacteraeota bacterium]|nr:hypothetical protein [Candidatus Eremiobacteraeota bacterium]
MRHLVLALALLPLGAVACKAPPTTVACAISQAAVTATCTVDGVTLPPIAIPPDVAAVVGIVAPFTNGVVTSQSVARIGAASNVTSSLNTKTHVVTVTNPSTGKSASFEAPS